MIKDLRESVVERGVTGSVDIEMFARVLVIFGIPVYKRIKYACPKFKYKYKFRKFVHMKAIFTKIEIQVESKNLTVYYDFKNLFGMNIVRLRFHSLSEEIKNGYFK